MTDFAQARDNMIESQVRPNGVTDNRIIAAMSGIAREDFVPASRKAIAYMDEDVEIAPGRHLIEAMAFAKLLQLAEIRPEDKVLTIGAGTGYGSAVLSAIAASVVALESDPSLAATARQNLRAHGNVEVAEGPMTDGWSRSSPYDVILIEGRVGEVPQPLFAQLSANGRLLAVVGDSDLARAMIWTSHAGVVTARGAFDASVSPLPGFARKTPAFVF